MSEADGRDRTAEMVALHNRIAALEAELRESKRAGYFLDSVLKAVPVFISNLDPDFKIRYLNRYQPGHTLESARGTNVFDYIAPADHAIAHERIEQARSTGQITSFTVHHAAGANNQPASYITFVAPVQEPDGRVGVCFAAVDITQEEQRAQALREALAKLGLALDATGLGLWSWNTQTDEVVWDERMKALHLSDQPLAFKPYRDLYIHPDDRATLTEVSDSAQTSTQFKPTTFRIVRSDGSIRWVLTLGQVIRDEDGATAMIVGGTLDITRQRELEEQLRKSQRMAAISSLTAGVAHNFNNMLAVISPILELATELVEPQHRKMLQDASHASQRAAELVRQLMTYAGQSTSQQRISCELNGLLNAAVSICRRSFGAHISLRVEQRAPALSLDCNPGQIEQILVNLLLNARDAIEETKACAGTVTIRVRLEPRSPSEQGTSDFVCIDVLDDGAGITDQARARLFEPFFTTKVFGKGTGLGLATSYAIARDHGGTLTCPPAQASGTCFTLALPCCESIDRELRKAASLPVRPGTRVLVVDDDDAVRRTLCRVLTGKQFVVGEANSGASALEQLRAYPDTQVVLLDRSMPGGAGERFVPRIREIARAARIVFLSGRAIEPELAALADAVIAKPVTGSGLLEAIARVLSTQSD